MYIVSYWNFRFFRCRPPVRTTSNKISPRFFLNRISKSKRKTHGSGPSCGRWLWAVLVSFPGVARRVPLVAVGSKALGRSSHRTVSGRGVFFVEVFHLYSEGASIPVWSGRWTRLQPVGSREVLDTTRFEELRPKSPPFLALPHHHSPPSPLP